VTEGGSNGGTGGRDRSINNPWVVGVGAGVLAGIVLFYLVLVLPTPPDPVPDLEVGARNVEVDLSSHSIRIEVSGEIRNRSGQALLMTDFRAQDDARPMGDEFFTRWPGGLQNWSPIMTKWEFFEEITFEGDSWNGGALTLAPVGTLPFSYVYRRPLPPRVRENLQSIVSDGRIIVPWHMVEPERHEIISGRRGIHVLEAPLRDSAGLQYSYIEECFGLGTHHALTVLSGGSDRDGDVRRVVETGIVERPCAPVDNAIATFCPVIEVIANDRSYRLPLGQIGVAETFGFMIDQRSRWEKLVDWLSFWR